MYFCISFLAASVFSHIIIFIICRHLVDFPSLQRCIESYLCHRYKPYERFDDVHPNQKQTHHMLLLTKLDKLIVSVFLRLCEVFNQNLPNLKSFASASKLSVFKSAEKVVLTKISDANAELDLQEEFRSILNEKVRILRIPYILELIALMGESNSMKASELLCGLVRIRPSLVTEIPATVEESLKVMRM